LISGQPKRHLLTTGWSVFVSSKRLFAGDSVLFIRYLMLNDSKRGNACMTDMQADFGA